MVTSDLRPKWKYCHCAHAKSKICNIAIIYGRITKTAASHRKSGSKNTKEARQGVNSVDTYVLDGDEAVETFAFDGMRMSNDGGLSDQRMFNQHGLNISRTQQVTGHVEHVIDTSRYPQITVTVTLGT